MPRDEQRVMRPQLAIGVQRAAGVVEVHELLAIQPAEFAAAEEPR